ncbi:type I-E CRISPR-associated protein Cas6/Cse3/CasE [Streptomyces niveus]
MTTLTRIVLNPRHRAVRNDLADSRQLHTTLMRLVPDNLGPSPRAAAGLLYRLEPAAEPVVFVQTTHHPDLTALPRHYATAKSHDLTAMFTGLQPGLLVHYRITAAPLANRSATAVRNPVTGSRRGKHTPLTGDAALAWWHRRATEAGLEILTGHGTPRPFPRRDTTTGPHYRLTQFNGTARITDPHLLAHALTKGIGKGKPYGAGLLSLAHA